MKTVETVAEVQNALIQSASPNNGTLWLCFVDRINPLPKEAVEDMMSRYDPKSPDTLFTLAEKAGMETEALSKDWLIRDWHPDYRGTDDPTSQAINDVYDQCRLFLRRNLDVQQQEDQPFGFKIRETFSITPMGHLIADTIRDLHKAVVHPKLVNAEKSRIPIRMLSSVYPGRGSTILVGKA